MHNISLLISLSALFIFSIQLILTLRTDFDKKHKVCLSIFFITLITWQIAGMGIILCRTPESANNFYRIYISASTGFIYFYLPLSFCLIRHKYTFPITFFILVLFCISILINFTVNMIDSLYIGSSGFFVPVFNNRMIYVNLPAIVLFLGGVVKSIQEIIKTESALLRNRLFYFLTASFLIFIGLISNLTLLREYPVDILCTMIAGIILSYAIQRKRLLDFRKTFFRGALYMTLLTAAMGLFVLLSFLIIAFLEEPFPTETVLSAFLTLTLVFFLFFKSQNVRTNQSVWKMLSFGTSVYSYSLETFSSGLRKEHEFDNIFNLLYRTMEADFPLSGMIINLLKMENNELTPVYSRGSHDIIKIGVGIIKDTTIIGRLFYKTNLLISSELTDEGNEEKLRIIRNEYGGQLPDVIISFRINEEVIGIAAIFLDAASNFLLDSELIEYLGNIGKQTEDAIFRAFAYQKLEQDVFNRDNLIKDINHRVKNNLQMIIGLLSMQGTSSATPEIREAMETASRRVSTIAKIHEMLYVEGVVNSINLKVYINEIVDGFKTSTFSDTEISFIVDVPDLLIDTEKALTICLVINELLSNSIKYAFHQIDAGIIMISVRLDDGQLNCLISDNGSGIGENPKLTGKSGIGHNLVRTFVEKQLKGSWEILNNGGTVHRIIVPFHQ